LSSKRQELLTLHEHLGLLPVFGGVCVAHLFNFLFWVFCFVCLCFGLMSCVPYVASFSGLFVFVLVLCLVYPMLPVSLDCLSLSWSYVLCTLCCQFLWIVCLCLGLMSCVSHVASFSGLSILDCPISFL
jgi:hypothetical protein